MKVLFDLHSLLITWDNKMVECTDRTCWNSHIDKNKPEHAVGVCAAKKTVYIFKSFICAWLKHKKTFVEGFLALAKPWKDRLKWRFICRVYLCKNLLKYDEWTQGA